MMRIITGRARGIQLVTLEDQTDTQTDRHNESMTGFMGMGMAGNMMGGMSNFMQGAATSQDTMVNQNISTNTTPQSAKQILKKVW